MAAGVIAATTPYCRACGWDFILVNTGIDTVCDSCGDRLAESMAGVLAPPADLVAALGTDEVIFTWTALGTTDDIEYSIAGAAFVFDDAAVSQYTVAAGAVQVVLARVRTFDQAIPGFYSGLL